MDPLTALVLAGKRGKDDSTDAMGGSEHRALVRVGGVPMLARVVRALREAPSVGRIVVSIDEPSVLGAETELQDLESRVAGASPSRSVLEALDAIGDREAVLVTTADHALLSPAMVEHLTAAAASSDADVLVGVVDAEVVRARHPDAVRTFLRLQDGGVTGANLFLFRTPRARRVADLWVRAERFRKQPWRLVAVFGPIALVLFALRRLSLDGALERVSRAAGATVRAVRLPFAEAAIDVDRPSDLELVERILRER